MVKMLGFRGIRVERVESIERLERQRVMGARLPFSDRTDHSIGYVDPYPPDEILAEDEVLYSHKE